MNLMEQCQVWNEEDSYQKIIDAIEALPQEQRTPELDSELARAYNNIAGLEDRALFEKAAGLLKSHEQYFQNDHSWNFRLAYAYYYLDREEQALRYFEKALEARPGDEDTQEFIDDCRGRLALPRFAKSFRERVQESWALFEQKEAELRSLMDQHEMGEELIETCSRLLAPAFTDISFELGYNGQKYELILTSEGDRAKLFELVRFQRCAPRTLLERWNILVGRQASSGFSLRFADQEVSCKDVRVWVERSDEKSAEVSLTLYCESLLPLLKENEGRAWWMLSTLTDQVLGEIPAMSLIDGFEVTDTPKAGPAILLEELPEVLKKMGLELNGDPEHFLDHSFMAYQMEPDENPESDWRLDVFTGVTRCPRLINEYLHGETGVMDAFHQDGAVPGFFCYPLDCFAEEADRSMAVLDFRDALEAAVREAAGEDAFITLGGATGIFCGYLDFIAWDLAPVLQAAEAFFKDSPVAWANFHTFRRGVSTVRLKAATETSETNPKQDARDQLDAVEEHDPPALAKAMMDYLACPCVYFPSMADDEPIQTAFQDARRRGSREGFVPILAAVDDTLWECLIMNTDEDSDGAENHAFDAEKVAAYRRAMLAAPVGDGRAVLQELLEDRKSEAGDDDMDWDEDVLGDMTGGEVNDRFLGYWDYPAKRTMPLILAEIPVKNPWEIFAYLPFGNWNECPDTPALMAVAKHWYEQYGASAAALTHDVLELTVPKPIPEERAMELAQEQYAFCPDVVDQGPEDATVGALADVLRQSKLWYFWWD